MSCLDRMPEDGRSPVTYEYRLGAVSPLVLAAGVTLRDWKRALDRMRKRVDPDGSCRVWSCDP